MAKKDLTDKEISANIFLKLAREKKWGGSYRPKDSVIRWIEGRLKKDGKRIRKIIKQLIKEGLLLEKKSGEVISLNPKRKGDIINTIEKILNKNFY